MEAKTTKYTTSIWDNNLEVAQMVTGSRLINEKYIKLFINAPETAKQRDELLKVLKDEVKVLVRISQGVRNNKLYEAINKRTDELQNLIKKY